MRISVTTLDSFRLFRDPDCEFIDQNEMIARILRKRVEKTYEMWRGIALHKVLDNPSRWFDGGAFYVVEAADLADNGQDPPCGFRFDAFSIEQVLKTLPEGPTEIKAEYPICGAVLVGIADRISGITGWDYKSSTKAARPDNLADSVQWRCYLEMFALDRFVYLHLQLRKDNRGSEPFYEIVDASEFEHYRYPAMRPDIENLISDYVDFVRMAGLEAA